MIALWGAAQHGKRPGRKENRPGAESDETGAQLVEYVLLALLIVMVAMVGVKFFGQKTSVKFSEIAESVGEVMP